MSKLQDYVQALENERTRLESAGYGFELGEDEYNRIDYEENKFYIATPAPMLYYEFVPDGDHIQAATNYYDRLEIAVNQALLDEHIYDSLLPALDYRSFLEINEIDDTVAKATCKHCRETTVLEGLEKYGLANAFNSIQHEPFCAYAYLEKLAQLTGNSSSTLPASVSTLTQSTELTLADTEEYADGNEIEDEVENNETMEVGRKVEGHHIIQDW